MPDATTIYVSASHEAVERLARLDSAPTPPGPVLVAALDGRPVAALPLDGGPAIADPFEYTAEAVSVLQLRLGQMHGRPSLRRGGGFAGALHDLARVSRGLAAGA